MKVFLKSGKKFVPLFILILITAFNVIKAQENITCKINGKNFTGKIENAVLVSLGNEDFIQIRAVDDDKIMYLYIKTAKLKNETPVTLNYKDHDTEKGQTPDAEIVWAPDGPERPQWNSVDGALKITQYDPGNKTISGTFEFTVEKFSYSSKANDSRPSAKIEDGKFENVLYKVEKK